MAQRNYAYAGTTIAVSAASETHLQWLDEFLSPAFQVSGDTPSWEVRLEFEASLYDRWLTRGPSGREAVTFVMDTQVITLPFWKDAGQARLLHDANSSLFFQIDGRQIRILCREYFPKVRTPLMRVIREIAMGTVQQDGALLLHAAAFAIGDRAAIIGGPKEAGKTSLLTYALTTTGAKYLTNDRLVCEAGSPGLRARGLPTVISIRPGTLSLLPSIRSEVERKRYQVHSTMEECRAADAPPARTWKDGRLGLSPAQFCAASGCDSRAEATAAMLLFPRQTGRPGGLSLERLNPAQAARRLADCQFGQGRRPVLSEAFTELRPGSSSANSPKSATAAVNDLLAALPAFDCLLGEDAFSNPRGSAQLVSILGEES